MSTPTLNQKSGATWTVFLLGGVLLLLFAVLAANTWSGLSRVDELSRESLTQMGEATVRSLEAATRGAMRHGGMRGRFRLGFLVEEMASRPNVKSIVILGSNGEPYAASGRADSLPDSKAPLAGLSPNVLRAIEHKLPFHRFLNGELLVGRPFDPFRGFRGRGRALPSWACPVGPDGEPQGLGPGGGQGRGAAWRRRNQPAPPPAGHMMGPGPMPDYSEEPQAAYALVRLATPLLAEARARYLSHAFVMAGVIFLAAGVVAFAMWGLARRRQAEVERLKEEIAGSRHLAAVGRLAGSIAHEVRNPLSAVRGLVQLLAKGQEPGSKKEQYAKTAVAEVDRLERVVGGLLEYTRPKTPRRVSLDLAESASGTLDLLRDDARADGVELKLASPPDLPRASADPDQVRQVLLNLMINALEAVDGRGAVTVRLSSRAGLITAEVSDDGPGLPAGDPEQLFDPFFSTRERGTGLGLAIARQIARAHGGELKAASRPGGGALFTFTLPAEEAK